MSLGRVIKERRKKLKITQKELAEGICVQAMISKIENDELKPSKDKLDLIAQKLKVDVAYLLEEDDKYGNEDYSEILIVRIKNSLANRDYEDIHYLFETNYDTIQRLDTKEDNVFFGWIEAIIEIHIYKKYNRALMRLNTLDTEGISKDLSISIINEIGKVHYLNGDFTESVNFFEKGLKIINSNVSYEIHVRLLFNYALVLDSLERYKEVLDTLLQGIDLLVHNKSMYLLGDLYYQKGYLYRNIEDYKEAIKSYKLASTIFEIENNNRFKALAELELKELSEIMEE